MTAARKRPARETRRGLARTACTCLAAGWLLATPGIVQAPFVGSTAAKAQVSAGPTAPDRTVPDPTVPDPGLWTDQYGIRYTNRKAMRVGDIITVVITESSQGQNRSSLRTRKESTFEAQGGPGQGPLGFLPLFGARTEVKNELDGSGQTSLSGQLSATITAQVIEIRPNGHLVIEGSRLVSINGDEDRITLHGVARPEDIRADNTILSTFLADARISYHGKGPAHAAAQKGIFLRVLSWFF